MLTWIKGAFEDKQRTDIGDAMSQARAKANKKMVKNGISCVAKAKANRKKIMTCFAAFEDDNAEWNRVYYSQQKNDPMRITGTCKAIFCGDQPKGKAKKACIEKCKAFGQGTGMLGGAADAKQKTRFRYLKVSADMVDVLDQSAALLTRMYGDGSHYSKWIEGGFRPYTRKYLVGQVSNPDRTLWVGMDRGIVVGTIIMQRVRRGAEVPRCVMFHKFAVDPVYKGFGGRLLSFAERKAREERYTLLRIEVFNAATKLVNYYIGKKYDRIVGVAPLLGDEHTKFRSEACGFGFITLEKHVSCVHSAKSAIK